MIRGFVLVLAITFVSVFAIGRNVIIVFLLMEVEVSAIPFIVLLGKSRTHTVIAILILLFVVVGRKNAFG